MPRTNPGLDYFPLDVDIDNDDKIELIEAKHGIVGFAVIIRLFMKIYRNGYYYQWGEKEQLLFSKRLNVDINTLNAIITDGIAWEIFNEQMFNEWNILTSKGIQKRYIEAAKRRKQVELIEEYLLLDNNCLNEYENVLIVDIKEDNVNIIKQSKVKESRVEESRVSPQSVVNLYNEKTSSLPKVQKLTDKRKRQVKTRLREYPTLTTYEELFTKAENSDFLSGRNGKWSACNFDWLLNENNMVKVLEGNYDNKEPAPVEAKFVRCAGCGNKVPEAEIVAIEMPGSSTPRKVCVNCEGV